MDLGKKAVSGVYNTVNNVGSTLSNAFSGGSSNAASVYQSQVPAPAPAPTSSQTQFQSIAPAPQYQSTIPQPAQNQTYQSTVPQYFTPTPEYTQSKNQTSLDYLNTVSRPSTTIKGATDQYGRVSNRDVGQQYKISSEFGADQLVTPKTAFSGLSGFGGGGLSISSTPATGASGITPFSMGGSGVFNPIGTTAVPSQDKATKKQDQANGIRTISQQTGSQAQAPVLPNVSGIQPQAQLGVNVPSGSINVGNLEATKGLLNKLINTPEALTSSDVASLNQNIDQAFALSRQLIDSQSPTPQNPIVDTPEQSAFAEASGDPFGVRQALDEFKAQNTNLAELQTSRLDVIKNIQALNQAYSPILDDIKNNPNLPKALASRRLEQVQEKQKTVLEGFLNQLELTNQSISDQDKIVNRAFGIVEFSQNANENAQQQELSKLKLFMDSGAIGAFTEADINKYANATGVSAEVIRKAKDSSKSPELSIITETDSAGNVSGIDKNTGKVIWKTSGVGKASITGDLSPAQQQAAFKLSDDFEKASGGYFAQRDAYNRVIASAKNPSAAGDLALIFNYMKVLDPGSTVREGEFATAQNSGSISDIVRAKYNSVRTGERLSQTQRDDFVNRSTALFNSAKQQQESTNKTYSERAAAFGIPSSYVIRDTSSTSQQIQVTPTNQNQGMDQAQAYALYQQMIAK